MDSEGFFAEEPEFNCFNGTEGTWLRTPCHLDEKHSAEESTFKKPGYSLFLRLIELKPYMGSSSTLKLRESSEDVTSWLQFTAVGPSYTKKKDIQ